MSTWHLFFAWPAGGTWSNMIASIEWVAVAGVFMWLFRDRIGRRLAAWWHKHHEPHLIAAHLKALEQHERDKLDRVSGQLAARKLQTPRERT